MDRSWNPHLQFVARFSWLLNLTEPHDRVFSQLSSELPGWAPGGALPRWDLAVGVLALELNWPWAVRTFCDHLPRDPPGETSDAVAALSDAFQSAVVSSHGVSHPWFFENMVQGLQNVHIGASASARKLGLISQVWFCTRAVPVRCRPAAPSPRDSWHHMTRHDMT